MGAVFWIVSETNAKKPHDPHIHIQISQHFYTSVQFYQGDTIGRLLCAGGQAGSWGMAEVWPCDRSPFPQHPNKTNRTDSVAAVRVSRSPVTAEYVCRVEADLRSSQKIWLARQDDDQDSVGASPAHLHVAQVSTRDNSLILISKSESRPIWDFWLSVVFPAALSKVTQLCSIKADFEHSFLGWEKKFTALASVPSALAGSWQLSLRASFSSLLIPKLCSWPRPCRVIPRRHRTGPWGPVRLQWFCTCFMSQKFGISSSPAQCLSLVNR